MTPSSQTLGSPANPARFTRFGPPDIDRIVEGREVDVMSEIMILALFPIDVVLAKTLSPRVAEEVREGVRERFIRGLQDQLGPELALSPKQVEGLREHITSRFGEYASCARRLADAAADKSRSGDPDRGRLVMEVGLEIGRNLVGRDSEPFLAAGLAPFVTTIYFHAVAAELDRYELPS